MINKQDIFNLRNLMYLYALSKTKNKKAVSDEFGISIDTLNKYIIDLENSIKTKLVFSNARGTMINPEGQLVLEIASEIARRSISPICFLTAELLFLFRGVKINR